MASLVNEAPAASDVLGRSALALDDSVRLAPDFPSRVAAVERWAAMMVEKREPDAEIERASRLLMAGQGRMRIGNLVRRSGLSASQFQRRFAIEVGMTPKLFARTIRFDAAMAAHHNPRTDHGRILSMNLGISIRPILSANAALLPACSQAASSAIGKTRVFRLNDQNLQSLRQLSRMVLQTSRWRSGGFRDAAALRPSPYPERSLASTPMFIDGGKQQ